MRPDKDGDTTFGGSVHEELRRSGNNVVRVHIPVGVKPDEAVRALKKIIDWIGEEPHVLEGHPRLPDTDV